MWSPSGKEGKTYRQIARETGVSPAQAQRIYVRAVEHQPENPQRSTHRPAPKTIGERSAAGEEGCRQNAIRDSR
jgi:hypothetical protein